MKDYKKYYIIPAQPEEVYAALTTEGTIQLWTGDKVEMVAEAGTEFSLWDGSITGRNIAFEPGRSIEQEWYFGDQEEQSIVKIILHPHKQGTSAELRHSNIPDDDYDDFVDGWNAEYFGNLIEFYEE